jgi:predicted ATPase with chaperone activity
MRGRLGDVPAARYQELSSNLPAESSAQIKARVNKARGIQRERFSAKILKASRTIADSAGSENIKTEHLSEAAQYRSLDKQW